MCISSEEQSNLEGRSLVKRHQESFSSRGFIPRRLLHWWLKIPVPPRPLSIIISWWDITPPEVGCDQSSLRYQLVHVTSIAVERWPDQTQHLGWNLYITAKLMECNGDWLKENYHSNNLVAFLVKTVLIHVMLKLWLSLGLACILGKQIVISFSGFSHGMREEFEKVC